jgi:hypothetical protein
MGDDSEASGQQRTAATTGGRSAVDCVWGMAAGCWKARELSWSARSSRHTTQSARSSRAINSGGKDGSLERQCESTGLYWCARVRADARAR